MKRVGVVRRDVILVLTMVPSLLQGGSMDPVKLNDPQTVYPNDPAMLEFARLVMRDDGRTLEEALKRNPSATNTMGRHNVGLLLLAVGNVKPNAVRVLMRSGADAFWPTSAISNLGSPATYALNRQTQPDVFTVMLEEGLDVNGGADGETTSLLERSVLAGDDQRLRQLLATGKANVNLADSVQNTPFIHAIDSTQYKKALLLLDAGADPRMGRRNMLNSLVNRHDKWAPGTPNDRDRKDLISRLQVLGMTTNTPMQPAPQRAAGTRHKQFLP